MSVKIKDIKNFFEKVFSNVSIQYEWDNSGAQILTGKDDITKVGFALDPTKEVMNRAIDEGCELLITHHPLFFAPLKNINAGNIIGGKIQSAIKNDLNIMSYHTCLDMAAYSLNDYLADILGASAEGFVEFFSSEKFNKFVCFVPEGYEDKIIDAIDFAGGGSIGEYSKCTFYARGTGTFLPGENTDPFIGHKGSLGKVDEYRIETIVPEKYISSVVNSVSKVHPYEEMAYDVYPMDIGEDAGIGRICRFDKGVNFRDFLSTAASKLGVDVVKHNVEYTDFSFDKFAIVTGSGTSLWKKCSAKGVKVLLTGDLKHHEALDAAEAGVAIVDCGHFHTERIYMGYLADLLKEKYSIFTKVIDETPSIKNFRG